MHSRPSGFVRVNADIRVGQFGGLGVAQSMNQGAGDGLGVRCADTDDERGTCRPPGWKLL
jgi:hypothetical protein